MRIDKPNVWQGGYNSIHVQRVFSKYSYLSLINVNEHGYLGYYLPWFKGN